MSDCNENVSRTSRIFADSSEMDSEGTLCRLCMKSNHIYYNIFTSNIACQITVEDALQDLVGLRAALGDGLPVTICHLCFNKLMEFNDFKKICFESDAALREISSRNEFRSIQGEEAADVKLESSDETKDDCIQGAIESSSPFAISVQTNEIYIPVPDGQPPRDNMLFHVKEEEEEDPLSEGDYPVQHVSAQPGVASDVLDPLAADHVHQVSTASRGEEVEDEAAGAIMPDIKWMLSNVKKEPCTEDNDAAEPTSTENGELIGNWTMSHGEMGLPASDRVTSQTPSSSNLLAGRNVRIDISNDCITTSSPVTRIDSKTEASDGGEEKDVIAEDLKKPQSQNMSPCFGNPFNPVSVSRREKRSFPCGECAKCFTKRSILKRHMARTHSGEKPFQCSECAKAFAERSTLKKHMRVHTGERPYSCSLCHKSFTLNYNLESHMRSHAGDRPFSCGECGKSYSRKCHLGVHMRSHTGERPHLCNLCGKSFVRRFGLDQHMRTHTGEKPYLCEFCSKTFRNTAALNSHLRTHTGEKPYMCGVCGKSFSQRCSRDLHLLTHTGEKPYACSECDKCFSRKGRLADHLRLHTGEKPFPCSVCSRCFASNSTLKGHMLTHK